MTPIIDPMLFYWIDMLNSLKSIFIIVALIGMFGGILFLGFGIIEGGWDYDYEPEKKLIHLFVKIIICGVTAGIINVFIPSETTMYKMLLAKNITPDNIETVQGELTELVDYIIDKVDQLND